MKPGSRLLLNRLFELARARHSLEGEALDELKAHLMIVTSSSPDLVGALDRLGYGPLPFDELRPEEGERCGLHVPSAGTLLSDFVLSLLELQPSVLEELPWSRDELQAALTAIWAVLCALEWSSDDSQCPERFEPDQAARLLRATLGSLKSYRETGEP